MHVAHVKFKAYTNMDRSIHRLRTFDIYFLQLIDAVEERGLQPRSYSAIGAKDIKALTAHMHVIE